jgi:hypothetical protein
VTTNPRSPKTQIVRKNINPKSLTYNLLQKLAFSCFGIWVLHKVAGGFPRKRHSIQARSALVVQLQVFQGMLK